MKVYMMKDLSCLIWKTILGTSIFVAFVGIVLWLYNRETTDFVLQEATIKSLHNSLFAGKVTCAQIVDEYIERINKYDHLLRSVQLINPQAKSRAIELDSLSQSQKVSGHRFSG